MQSKRIFICGGVKPVGGRKSKANTQALDTALRLNLWQSAPGKNVTLQIDDIQGPLLRSVPDRFQDFVEIATYIYCADQAIKRNGDGVETFGDDWRRELELHIPVRSLDFWNSDEVNQTLAATVGFLSDDLYRFVFYPAKGAPGFQQYLGEEVTATNRPAPEQVVMFSGGLDSLAGAVQEAVQEKRRVFLVNHRSTEKLNQKHKALIEALGKAAGTFAPGLMRVRINKGSDLSKDPHQRARSLLYSALGGTVAHMLGAKSLRFYENGVVALNLPVSAQVVGGRATRTAHPRVLSGFQDLLTLVADAPFTVENPFLWSTRGELIKKIVDAGCGDLIAKSMSCSHTMQMSNVQTHCGLCSQCIDRRLGVVAAGAEAWDPPGQYGKDLFTAALPKDTDKLMVAGYLERANRVGEFEMASQFVSRFPEVLDVVPYVAGGTDRAVAKVFDLYQRHSKEVIGAVDVMLNRHSVAIRKRSLPSDGILRMVYESGSTESVAVGGADGARSAPVSTGETPAMLDGLAEIKKHTDMIPGLVQMVESTPVKTAALLKGTIRRKFGTCGAVSEEDFTASADFTQLQWRGKTYVVVKSAAQIIEAIYIAQRTYQLPGLSQQDIFTEIYGADKKKWPAGKPRVQNYFRSKDSQRLWNDGLIGHDGQGNFQLSIKIHTHTQ